MPSKAPCPFSSAAASRSDAPACGWRWRRSRPAPASAEAAIAAINEVSLDYYLLTNPFLVEQVKRRLSTQNEAAIGLQGDGFIVREPLTRIEFEQIIRPEYRIIEQHVWLLEGTIEVASAGATWRLAAGDCLHMRLDQANSFRNVSGRPARYAVILTLEPMP